MKLKLNFLLIPLPILLLIAGSVIAEPKKAGPGHGAPKIVKECGTVLTEPGNYKLVNDLLDCPGNGVEIIGSDISLNLHGHAIACADNNLEVAGVAAYSLSEGMISNVTIKNGHVSNCRDGIVLVQTEDSKVMNITSTGNTQWNPAPEVFVYGTGITLWMSRNNVIMHNHTYANASDGIGSWESSGNLFKHNTSTGNGDGWQGAGINLSNENNSRVMCNRVHGNSDGVTVWWGEGENGSGGNLIRGNLVTENQNGGIAFIGFYWQDPDSLQEWYYAMSRGNTVRSNIVEQNPFADLIEAHWDYGPNLLPNPSGECKNIWENNQFGTEIGVPGCMGAPVELDEKDVCALDDDNDD